MYDHFIAVDWAQANMAIARMTGISDKITTHEGPTDLFGLQSYLKTLKGAKILTLEESTGAQWLYTELKPLVDKILICDPYRNHLLSEGAKTDKIDASKLVQLLRANLLKEVFHSGDELIHIRKIMSAYADLVVAGVRLKNQRSALFRSAGKSHKEDTSLVLRRVGIRPARPGRGRPLLPTDLSTIGKEKYAHYNQSHLLRMG
jgi:hypothetical protein